jgi:VWFA-related protein
MMKKLAVLAIASVFTLPALAVKRVTVAQVEQSLAAANSTHRADVEVARQLGEIELTERLTDATLNKFAAHLTLGPRTALALQLLADQSAFLDPPPNELPATAPPDAAAQERMMDEARGYVVSSWPHLPDFFVTRTTNRFDDGPQVLETGGWPVRAGLHVVGTASRQVTYRDGQEVQDEKPQSAAAPASQQELGMRSWGEFGPALTIILADAAKGQVTWSHWEETPAGLAAVFHYSVPRAASHYGVTYCCVTDPSTAPRQPVGYGNRSRSQPTPLVQGDDAGHRTFSETPGYHGSLAIDPATGAVLRVTLDAELKAGDPLLRAATVIEYGAVTVGDRRFYFPARSLAFSMEERRGGSGGGASVIGSAEATDKAWGNATSHADTAPVLLLNETSFTHYHRLGTTTRILAAGAGPGAVNPVPAAANAAAASSGIASASANSAASAAPSATALPVAPNPAATAPASTTEPANAVGDAATPAPVEPAIPEITRNDAASLPDQPAVSLPERPGFSLKVTSRLVDIGLVAVDKKGHPNNDLKQEEIEVYDNGRKQEVRFFSQSALPVANAAIPAPTAGPSSEQSFSNRASDTAAPAAETGATILLLDESHIAWGDMNNARQQLIKFLSSVAPGERVGLYSMNGLGFHVLMEATTDHAALLAKVQTWMPTAQSVSQAQDEEMRNRQQFNEVHNVADLNSVNGNRIDVPDSSTPVDPQLLTLGSNPARASLIILGAVARHLAALAGHKNLVWVSSDNVLADWQDQTVGIDKSPRSIDNFALRAQEAMNEAHAAVYPFDVAQLETAAISADIQHRNVELTPAAADIAGMGGGSAPKDNTPGRISAEMSQDLHPIQGPIRQVAVATGGRAIRRAGDLAAELNSIVEDGHATYLIGFHPDQPADGQYHNITVKLSGHRGVVLRYRTGYFYAKEPETLKARFQQAIWQPVDVNEIAVTAKALPLNPGATVQLEIAANDLSLEQQGGRWMDRLDIFFLQRDDAGLHTQLEGQTLGLRLKPATYQNLLQSGVPFEQAVQLKPGTASLRVVVVDENSGRMGSVTLPATALGAGQ